MATKKAPLPDASVTALEWYRSNRSTQIKCDPRELTVPHWMTVGHGLIAPVDGSKSQNIPAGQIYFVEVRGGHPEIRSCWRDVTGDGIAAGNAMAAETARVYRTNGKLITSPEPITLDDVNLRARIALGPGIAALDPIDFWAAYGIVYDRRTGKATPNRFIKDD